MKTTDIPPEFFNQPPQAHLQAAHQIAAALTKGGLSSSESGLVVHQWALHLKQIICPDNPKIPTPRRWK